MGFIYSVFHLAELALCQFPPRYRRYSYLTLRISWCYHKYQHLTTIYGIRKRKNDCFAILVIIDNNQVGIFYAKHIFTFQLGQLVILQLFFPGVSFHCSKFYKKEGVIPPSVARCSGIALRVALFYCNLSQRPFPVKNKNVALFHFLTSNIFIFILRCSALGFGIFIFI